MEFRNNNNNNIPSSITIYLFGYLILYLIGYFIIFRNWAHKLRPEGSSCFISFAHGTPAVILSIRALLSDPARNFHSPNTPFQNNVLDFSIAYFSMDLLHYLIFFPSDVLFIAHHLATLFVFITCRYVVHHGAFAILVLLMLAEVTSFCQNVWTLANARRFHVEFADKVYRILSPPFYVFYTIVRGLLGPYFLCRMISFYVTGEANSVIPMWVWVSWVLVVGMAISVSIFWITNLWIALYAERKKQYIVVEKKTS